MVTTSELVDRVARRLPSRIGRRSFLARAAVVGSAVAAEPLSYLLEPTTAYGAVCNCKGSACQCGSACCDGYTEFCCTITGANRCPPGTIVAGWWKADTAPEFCGGPRYYLDCNAPCNGCGCGSSGLCSGACSGTGCGCVGGDCNNRAAGCNLFRYGQCHQEIACLGPIVCRVVTCVPPWAIEPSCTTVTRVDEYTAHHDSPCLHAPEGVLDSVTVEGDRTHLRGWALDSDVQGPVTVRVFIVDQPVSVDVVADAYRPDVGAARPGYGDFHGFDVTIPHTGLAHTVCVAAFSAGYGNQAQFLGCPAVPARTTGPPFGMVDAVVAHVGRVQVQGWVIDPDRPDPTAVHVYVDGRFVTSAVAELPRPDVVAGDPAAGPSHGFDVSVAVPPGPHDVCVFGINIGDVSPNPLIGCRSVDVPSGTPIGAVEQLTTGPGFVRVVGWVLDPDTTEPVEVRVYSDNQYLGHGPADRVREDVGAFFGLGAAHGFDLQLAVPAGTRAIGTFGVNRQGSGGNRLLDARTVEVPAGPPFGFLDVVEPAPGGARVAGWAVDPDTSGPITVQVDVDGHLAAQAPADRSRSDVGGVLPYYGDRHGFDLVVPLGRGSHVVTVYAVDSSPGAPTTAIGSRAVTVG